MSLMTALFRIYRRGESQAGIWPRLVRIDQASSTTFAESGKDVHRYTACPKALPLTLPSFSVSLQLPHMPLQQPDSTGTP